MNIVNITMGNPYVNPHVNRPFTVGTYEPPEHPMKSAHRLLEGTARLKEMCPGMTFVSSGISYLGAMAPYVAEVLEPGTASLGFNLSDTVLLLRSVTVLLRLKVYLANTTAAPSY